MSNNYDYVDLSLLTRIVISLFAISIISGLYYLFALVMQVMLLNDIHSGAYFTMNQAFANDERVATSAMISVATGLISFVAFMVWVFRAHANLHGRNIAGLRTTPWFAVGQYFVPFVNFYLPGRSMADLERCTKPNVEDWRKEPVSAVVVFWWLLWLTSGVVAMIATRQIDDLDYEDTLGLVNHTLVLIGSEVIAISSAILLVVLFKRIGLDRSWVSNEE